MCVEEVNDDHFKQIDAIVRLTVQRHVSEACLFALLFYIGLYQLDFEVAHEMLYEQFLMKSTR
jgi:hypothetical protein